MREVNLLIVVLSFLTFYACQNTAAPQDEATESEMTFDEAQEEAAILQVIEGETKCFYERNYDCWKNHWAARDYACLTWSNSDGTFSAKVGWEAIDSEMGDYIKENPVADNASSHPMVKRKDLAVRFYGQEAAYLTWEQYNSDRETQTYQKSREVRVLEKVDGEWKIVNVSAFWDYNKIPADSLAI